jgi:hypothetical protein
LGKRAKRAKGSPNARPNPANATVSWTGPPLLLSKAPMMSEPSRGPVQENETSTSVKAIKNIPPILVRLDFESTVLEKLLGSVISNNPKKERANARKIAVYTRLTHTFVEILFNIPELLAGRK